jgi:hypothetical protein
MNLEHSIAITQNFVSPRNLARVLHFLRERRDQVSGYCGAAPAPAAAGAEQGTCAALPSAPPELYEAFVTALQAHGGYGEVLKRAMQESHALVGGARGRKRKAAPSTSIWAGVGGVGGGDDATPTPSSFAFSF